jgi:hypothetical protein
MSEETYHQQQDLQYHGRCSAETTSKRSLQRFLEIELHPSN